MAMADCETTAQAAAGAMAARREQRERRASFPDAAARAEATKGCLGALNEWAALVSPVLTPVPDLGGITEELCREARDNALRLVPRELAPAAQAAGRKMYGRDRDFAQEVRDALR
jgi:hypothetical protein